MRVIKYVHAWCESDVKRLKAVAAHALHCVRQRSMLAGGCWAALRAGTGVRDLGCAVELCSVPGWLVSVLLLRGLREGRSLMRGPAADAGRQGVLGECGLGTTKPSLLVGEESTCLLGLRGLSSGKGFGVLRESPLLRSIYSAVRVEADMVSDVLPGGGEEGTSIDGPEAVISCLPHSRLHSMFDVAPAP